MSTMSSPTTVNGLTREGTRIVLREITATLHNSSSPIQTFRRKSGAEASPDTVKSSHEHEVKVRFNREFAEVAEVGEIAGAIAEEASENIPQNAPVIAVDSRTAISSPPSEEGLSSTSGSFQSLASNFSVKSNIGVQHFNPAEKLNGFSANASYINTAIPGIEDLILGCADIHLNSEEEEEERSFSTLQDTQDISQDQTFASATDEAPLDAFDLTSENLTSQAFSPVNLYCTNTPEENNASPSQLTHLSSGDSGNPSVTDLEIKKLSSTNLSHSITRYETCEFTPSFVSQEQLVCGARNDEILSENSEINCPTTIVDTNSFDVIANETSDQNFELNKVEAKECQKVESNDTEPDKIAGKAIDDSDKLSKNLSSQLSPSANDAIHDILPELASPIKKVNSNNNTGRISSSPSVEKNYTLSTPSAECTNANSSTQQTAESPAISLDNSLHSTNINAPPLAPSENKDICDIIASRKDDAVILCGLFNRTAELECNKANIEKSADPIVTILEESVNLTKETVDTPALVDNNVNVSIEKPISDISVAPCETEHPDQERSPSDEHVSDAINFVPPTEDNSVQEKDHTPTNLDDTITLEDVCTNAKVLADDAHYAEFQPQRQSTALATTNDQLSFEELKQAAQDVADDIYNSSLEQLEAVDRFASCEIFQDPTSFDFLLARSNSKNTIRDLRTESLYVKFDPLVGNVSMLPQGNNQTISEEEDRKPSDTSISDEPTDKPATPKRNPAIAAIDRLLFYSPLPGNGTDRKSPEAPEKNEAKPADASVIADANMAKELELVRSTVLQLEEELEKQKKEHQIELEAQKAVFQEKLNKLQTQLTQELKNKNQMTVVMDEYEKSISRLVSERERDRVSLEQEKSKLQEELQAANHHLNNTEAAFNDVHLKYERLKGVVSAYKSNETVLKESIQENVDTIKALENRYDQLKSHAMAQLEKANLELDAIKKQHEAETVKLHAMVRKAELKSNSLAELVEQKTKENKELTQILDEVIARVGRQNAE